MRFRPKLFLTFALVSTFPLLLLTVVVYFLSLQNAKTSLRSSLDNELAATIDSYDESLKARDEELRVLKASAPISAYIQAHVRAFDTAKTNIADGSASHPSLNNHTAQVKDAVLTFLATQSSYLAICAFGPDKRTLFLAEPSRDHSSVILREGQFLQNGNVPADRVWNAAQGEVVCTIQGDPATGTIRRCSVPVETDPQGSRGVVMTVVSLDALISDVARHLELSAGADKNRSLAITVLDGRETIVYHTNDALKHQQASKAIPDFAAVARAMVGGLPGALTYHSASGDEWIAVYGPLSPRNKSVETENLSLAVSRNISLATQGLRRAAWLAALVAVLMGLGVATFLTSYYVRQTRGLERVTQSVAAIAKGELDLRVDARSREDIRPLADSVNLMTEQMRVQLAREAETRQVESFVRLSAMLTHDLKNAIGSLSLLVTNMEQHFANEEFRADAMRSLTGATQKLRALVERLSNPVTTLSGEFRRPESVDLVPLIQRVIADTAGPMLGSNRLLLDLPPALFARIDGERMEKVFENLVLNALEAMAPKPGTLTVSAGPETPNSVYVAISDTGIGMSSRFVEERLFHAFATTKKNGMGLGLYTCREVVHANGGSIEVHSKQGAGTTFRLVLPSPPLDELP